MNVTKDSRLLVRTIGELTGIEKTEDSWKIPHGDRRTKEVFLGRATVGRMKGEGTNNANDKFTIEIALIDEQARKLGFKTLGSHVLAEFILRMAS
jgi:hypothetical protein